MVLFSDNKIISSSLPSKSKFHFEYRFLTSQKVQNNLKIAFLLLGKCKSPRKSLSYCSENANQIEYCLLTARKVQITSNITFLLLRKWRSTWKSLSHCSESRNQLGKTLS